MTSSEDETFADKIVRRAKNNRVVGLLTAVGLGVIGAGAIIAAAKEVFALFPRHTVEVDVVLGETHTAHNYVNVGIAVSNHTSEEWKVTGARLLMTSLPINFREIANDPIDTINVDPHRTVAFAVKSQLLSADYYAMCGDTTRLLMAIDFSDGRLNRRTTGMLWFGTISRSYTGPDTNGHPIPTLTITSTRGRIALPSGEVSEITTGTSAVWFPDPAYDSWTQRYRFLDSQALRSGSVRCYSAFVQGPVDQHWAALTEPHPDLRGSDDNGNIR